jgi:hypothetical protein
VKEFLKYISLARLEQFGSQMQIWHPRNGEIRAVKQIWAYHPHIGAPASHFQLVRWSFCLLAVNEQKTRSKRLLHQMQFIWQDHLIIRGLW